VKNIGGDNKKILIRSFLLSFLGLAVALLLIKAPQKIEKRASAPEGTVSFDPSWGNFFPDQDFLISLKLNSGNWQISGVDFTLFFDASKIQIIDISPQQNILPEVVLKEIKADRARFVFVNPGGDSSLPHGEFVVAKITARGKSQGVAEITFSETYEVSKKQIADEGYNLSVTNIKEAKGSYTFTLGGETPTPSAGPTSSVACGQNGDLNNDGKVDEVDLMIVILSWSPNGPVPTPSPGFCQADVDNNQKVDEGDIGIVLLNWRPGI